MKKSGWECDTWESPALGQAFRYCKKRYGPLVGAKVGCGPSGALQVVARE